MRLAEELRSQGHECLLVALNDKHLKPGLCSLGHDGAINRKTMAVRLSSNENWRRRIAVVQKMVYEFQPDWISLQYVPYGYHCKGLPIFFSRHLVSLVGGFRWHFMFHELWIEPRGGLSAPLISILQKVHIANLCRSICPRKVHTSNEIYARKLARIGISASLLPLFSNIEKVPSQGSLRQKLVEECTPASPASDVWIFLFFGSIHPGWDVDVFLERISHAARKAGKKAVILLSIGKNPCQEHASLSSLRKIKTGFLHFREIGEMATSDISQFLQAADFGVATTPLGLLGKSGSAAAMASHGIPVVVPRIDVRLDQNSLDKKGILPVDEFFEEKLRNPPRPHKFDSVAEIAQLFLKTLDPNFQVR
jgi:glycosyltransferase involved in cell wall biosynthesis